ncbi:hypothetical protein MKX03_027510 [Papaver bracteatum]|nr:hypothetical protein MKX03_027510 [Papaver bracteatum]
MVETVIGGCAGGFESINGFSKLVNATNEQMLGGGGVDEAIHRVAGPELRASCYTITDVRPGIRCPKGEAIITL